MTRMIGPDCVVMCNLINTHTHTHTGSNKEAGGEHKVLRAQVRFVQVERVCSVDQKQPCRYRWCTHMSCIIIYPYSTYPCRGYFHTQ